ncbi:MAG: hypothetical protein ACLU9S_22280 [Oscillospiraceae bacterium]
MNLVIDEQTGLINKNSSALLGDIEAWKKNATTKALQEKYTDVLEEQGKAEASLIDAQAKRNRLEAEAAVIEKQTHRSHEDDGGHSEPSDSDAANLRR